MTATLSVILICLLLSAFFSGMEIAFLTSNKLRIEIDKSKKGVTQALIDLFISHSGMYITTLLVGNNVVMVIYGIFMSDLLVKQFEFLHLSIGVELFVETLVSTLIILVFAEFLPKTVFRLRSNLRQDRFSSYFQISQTIVRSESEEPFAQRLALLGRFDIRALCPSNRSGM